MYLDQTPMTERMLQTLIFQGLLNTKDEDADDPPKELHRMQDPTGLRVITETGVVFHVTINKVH